MRPAPTVQRLSPDKQIFRPRRAVALLRFANERKIVREPFLAIASRISTSLSFDAGNTDITMKNQSRPLLDPAKSSRATTWVILFFCM